MAPLIVRRPRTAACAAAAPAATRAAPAEAPSGVPDDMRLFATNFLGSLAFFGAYLA